MTALTSNRPNPVPVVLPHVRVGIDADGATSVMLDGEPYDVGTDFRTGRASVPSLIRDIANRLASPVHVEVIDGGATFTDIVTPTQEPDRPAVVECAPAAASSCEIAGSGFAPDERVAIAVVVAHQSADAHGNARLRLPPALLAGRPGLVVLLGQTSGAIALSGGTT